MLLILPILKMVPCNQTKFFRKNVLNINQELIGHPDDYFCLPDVLEKNMPNLKGRFGNAQFNLHGFSVK